MLRRKGFTLIELLVVVAIIALSASILLPALGAGKEAARCANCSTRLRNLALAANLYANENNHWLPTAGPRDRVPASEQYWFMNETLLQHVSVVPRRDTDGELIGPPAGSSPLACPSHPRPTRSKEAQPREYALSYVMNGTWGVGDWCSIDRRRRRTYEFAAPSEVLVLADGNNARPETVGTVLYHGCPRDNFDYRHGNSVNAVFLDSHVTSLKPDDIPFGRNKRFEPFWSEKK